MHNLDKPLETHNLLTEVVLIICTYLCSYISYLFLLLAYRTPQEDKDKLQYAVRFSILCSRCR